MANEWKLTDQEITHIAERGGDIAEAQKQKREAYTKAGGIILNPDALEDLYEALKGLLQDYSTNPLDDKFFEACLKARAALAKVEGR